MTYVVHLEDDETLQEILKVSFQATDPKVNLKQFITGDDVIAHIEHNVEAIDLFVLDIRVPGSIDGIGVARKIRELGSDAPVIMTSAYRAPDRETIDSLSLEWMSKPWHIMEISQRLITLAKKQRADAAKAAATVSSPAAITPPPIPAVPPQPAVPTPVAPAQVAASTPLPPAVKPASPVVETSFAPQASPSSPLTPSIKPKLTAAPPVPPKSSSGDS
ncbi:MAG: response regulator [Chloroflexota bacterium]